MEVHRSKQCNTLTHTEGPRELSSASCLRLELSDQDQPPLIPPLHPSVCFRPQGALLCPCLASPARARLPTPSASIHKHPTESHLAEVRTRARRLVCRSPVSSQLFVIVDH
ncbi:hypothetical protein Cni_G16946 [Canna indica]|uniref:Uncharacterized protein n=1 Tax=Canna indica TaxID=4628 RepID=A0AAQ3KGW2_9LILI|nr:hypothetical protein Cni_G16946 [Canna indica]